MVNPRFFSCLLVTASIVGCNQGVSPVPSKGESVATAENHEHSHEGPHHGSLIELGQEEFHAEFVHDANSVTIYVLDSTAKLSVPIDASEVLINLVHDGKPEQFALVAAPDTNDPNGKSSRYSSNDAALVGHIDNDSVHPKLSLTINGKPYRGVIAHSHEHSR